MSELLIGCGHRRNKLLHMKGQKEWDDLTTLDVNPDTKPDVLHDLMNLPLPFEDNRFDEIHAYEVLEHTGNQGDYKFFFAQFEEFWRILKSGGFLLGSAPKIGNVWVWGDPGHSRVIQKETLIFLSQEFYSDGKKDPASDYRWCYKGDFGLAEIQETANHLIFVLEAIKT